MPLYAAPCTGTNTPINSTAYTSLYDVLSVPDGYYKFNFGSGDFNAYVEDGWVLILEYHSGDNSDPGLSYVEAGSDWPIYDTTGLSDYNCGSQIRQAVGQSITDSSVKLRWFAETNTHSRVIHFESPRTHNWFGKGGGGISGITSDFTPLAGHTSFLPASADSFGYDNTFTDDFFNDFPFYSANYYHWGIGGTGFNQPNRWEVDDFPASNFTRTIHRVWVKSLAPPLPIWSNTTVFYPYDPSHINLKSIPGQDIVLDSTLLNTGISPDLDTVKIVLSLDINMAFRLGSVICEDGRRTLTNGEGGGLWQPSENFTTTGVTSSGLTVPCSTIEYSNVGTSGPWTYVPSADFSANEYWDGTGGLYSYDNDVRAIRISPTGTFANGVNGDTPAYRVYFYAKIK